MNNLTKGRFVKYETFDNITTPKASNKIRIPSKYS